MKRWPMYMLLIAVFALLRGCELKCETEADKSPAHKVADAVDDAVDAVKDATHDDHQVKIKIKKSD